MDYASPAGLLEFRSFGCDQSADVPIHRMLEALLDGVRRLITEQRLRLFNIRQRMLHIACPRRTTRWLPWANAPDDFSWRPIIL